MTAEEARERLRGRLGLIGSVGPADLLDRLIDAGVDAEVALRFALDAPRLHDESRGPWVGLDDQVRFALEWAPVVRLDVLRGRFNWRGAGLTPDEFDRRIAYGEVPAEEVEAYCLLSAQWAEHRPTDVSVVELAAHYLRNYGADAYEARMAERRATAERRAAEREAEAAAARARIAELEAEADRRRACRYCAVQSGGQRHIRHRGPCPERRRSEELARQLAERSPKNWMQ